MDVIQIRNARLHNLKGIDLEIPKGRFVVLTGVSGSGKSSLAFDLIYAEGRRRYLHLLGEQIPPEIDAFDEIRGLTPAVAVEQRILRQSNPRSSVGTRTKLQGSLQLLFALGGDGRREELPPAAFSPNTAQGMCLKCYGRGVVPGPGIEARLLAELAGELPLLRKTPRMLRESLERLAAAGRFDVHQPFRLLSDEAKQRYLHGCDATGFEGLIPFTQRVSRATPESPVTCPVCQGYRLGPEPLSVTIGGMHIGQVSNLTIAELAEFLQRHGQRLAQAVPLLGPVTGSMRERIECMQDVGLSHLSLWRSTPSLSGGELQRMFLATYLNADLENLLFVFDEPCTGLHELEKGRLIQRLRQLQAQGNTVLVVEHDFTLIQAADHVIEIGPGAGREGGEVVYQGDCAGYLACTRSPVVRALAANGAPDVRERRPVDETTPRLTLHGAQTNNLKRVTVQLPTGVLVGIAGVSGSGKSTLVSKTLVPLLQARLAMATEEAPETTDAAEEPPPTPLAEGLCGWEQIRRVAVVTQAPIGRQKGSTPASYVGLWDRIRALFARSPEAQGLGLTAAGFSFNGGGGCRACGGEGSKAIYVSGETYTQVCAQCHGSRYRPEVLRVTCRGKSIADLLTMTVAEVGHHFQGAGEEGISRLLQTLGEVGLGYLPLGQPSTTLSGGEAQRVKLAKELGRSGAGPTLYLLDEPTTGLSQADVARLIGLVSRLVERGDSVIIVEHDPTVLSVCDWIVELGPGGGAEGGEIIAEGPPAHLRANPHSLTGPFLRGVLP